MADIKNNWNKYRNQELTLKYYKLPDQLSKLHINPPGGLCSYLNEQNRTARKHEDWKNEYLHSALNTCILNTYSSIIEEVVNFDRNISIYIKKNFLFCH